MTVKTVKDLVFELAANHFPDDEVRVSVQSSTTVASGVITNVWTDEGNIVYISHIGEDEES